MGRQPKTDKDRVQNLVDKRRVELGLSRQDLADMVQVHYQTIGYIERGEYQPTLALAFRLAIALQCKIDDIFVFQGDNK